MQNLLFTKSLSQAVRKPDLSVSVDRLKAVSGDVLGLIGLGAWCLAWMHMLRLM